MAVINENDEVVTHGELLKIFDNLAGSDIRKFKAGLTLNKGDVVCDNDFNLFRAKRNIPNTTILNIEDFKELKLGSGSGFEELKKKLSNG